MDSKIKVMIVEDQCMPRQLFELFVNQSERFEVAISIDNAEVADLYCLHNPIQLVLMDVITKNGANGLEAAEKIKKHNPNIKIIIVTSLPEYSFLDKARKIGVEGFWYKEISKEPILSLMNRIMDGEIVYPDSPPKVKIGDIFSDKLTDKELEVLKELTGGYSNTEIAERLYMSVSAVKKHIEHLINKTGLKNRIELAVKARDSGLVILEEENEIFES